MYLNKLLLVLAATSLKVGAALPVEKRVENCHYQTAQACLTLGTGCFWTASGACSLATPGGCTPANIANTAAGATNLCLGTHQLTHIAANTEKGQQCVGKICKNPAVQDCVGACLGAGKEPERPSNWGEEYEMSPRPRPAQQLQPTSPMEVPAPGEPHTEVAAEGSHSRPVSPHPGEPSPGKSSSHR